MKRVGLIGYFGWGNFGDELFVQAHKQHLGGIFDVSVVHDLLEDPYFTRPLATLVNEYDAFLVGGGDLVNPLRVSSLYWQMDFLKKPVFVYGISVLPQPFRRPDVLKHYERFFRHENCKLVVARDRESYDWLECEFQLGAKLEWFPDPVCSLRMPPVQPQPEDERVLGIVMREHRSLEADMTHLRRLIDRAKELEYRVRHLVLATGLLGKADLGRARMIAEPDEEVFHSEDLNELCVAVGSCSQLATIKFHGMVVAAMYGVPSIAMSGMPKNANFLRMIDRSEMLSSYSQSDLVDRLSKFPARIHQRVRADLYGRATAGYARLIEVMNDTI